MYKEKCVDARGGKVLDFLKENNHLDLEVPDIAFSVKKSEKTVEAALLKLKSRGLVTARQNEYGRVYWYALPLAPITKTFTIDELQACSSDKPDSSSVLSDNEKVDICALHLQSKVNPEDIYMESRRGNVENKSSTTSFLPQQNTSPIKSINDTTQQETTHDPVTEYSNKLDDQDTDWVKHVTNNTSPKRYNLLILIPVVAIFAVLSTVALVKGINNGMLIEQVKNSIPKDVATSAELADIQEDIGNIKKLEQTISILMVQIDSLKADTELLKKNTEKRRASRWRRR